MKQLVTKAIVLSRTNFSEADRIVTVLTPDQGKLRLMAKGVRKLKSKLAGGIELFSVSEISYIKGKSEIYTLISSRLFEHYPKIVRDIDRVQLGYDLIKLLNSATEDHPSSEYFSLLEETFEALNDKTINLELISDWFKAQLLKYNGHTPNLSTDLEGNKLSSESKYIFDYDNMTFTKHSSGKFTADHIKILRLIFSKNSLSSLNKVENLVSNLPRVTNCLDLVSKEYIAKT